MAGTMTEKGPAPHLDEYFEVQKEIMGQLQVLADPIERLMIQTDPEKLKEFRATQEKFVQKLRDIGGKSFDHHDINNSGVLEVDESQALFSHFVERLVSFTINTSREEIEVAVAKQLEYYKTVLGDDNEAKIKEIEEQLSTAVKTALDQILATNKERGDAYATEKPAKDAAAFAALDKNGDGKLTKEAVVEALTPDTETHFVFLVALGMMTVDEVEEQKKTKVAQKAFIDALGA